MESPAGVKTLLIEFDKTSGAVIDNRDAIVANGAPAGMRRAFDGQQYLLFVSDVAIPSAGIQTFLQNNVSLRVYDTDANPKVLVYINADKNLGTSLASRSVSTFLEGFEALDSDVPIAPLYAGTVNIGWSASHFFIGGSAVAHASRTDAAYYQWELNPATGVFSALSGERNPTLVLGSLNGNMNGWQYRLKYGDSPTDPAMKTSNVLSLSFGFTNVAIPGESRVSGSGAKWEYFGNVIPIPAQYAANVTSVTFSYNQPPGLPGPKAYLIDENGVSREVHLEEYGKKFIHIFDSLSASIGEGMIALKISEFAQKGLSNLEIVENVNNFMKNMRTYFILDKFDNLVKTGRINPAIAKIASMLNIKPICAAKNGEITMLDKARGYNRAVRRNQGVPQLPRNLLLQDAYLLLLRQRIKTKQALILRDDRKAVGIMLFSSSMMRS